MATSRQGRAHGLCPLALASTLARAAPSALRLGCQTVRMALPSGMPFSEPATCIKPVVLALLQTMS